MGKTTKYMVNVMKGHQQKVIYKYLIYGRKYYLKENLLLPAVLVSSIATALVSVVLAVVASVVEPLRIAIEPVKTSPIM